MASAKSGGGGAPNGPPQLEARPMRPRLLQRASAQPRQVEASRRAPRSPRSCKSDRIGRASEAPPTPFVRAGRVRAQQKEAARPRTRFDGKNGRAERACDQRRASAPGARAAEGRSTSDPDPCEIDLPQDGRRRYFLDGARISRSRPRLSTPSENAGAIASSGRDRAFAVWDSITVRGRSASGRKRGSRASSLGSRCAAIEPARPSAPLRSARFPRRNDESRAEELPLDHPPGKEEPPTSSCSAKDEASVGRRRA